MFNKAKELLDSGKIDKDVFDVLNTEFETVVSKLNDENKTLRLDKENLSKNYNEVLKSKGDLDEQIKSIDEKISNAKNEGKQEVVKQLEAERADKQKLQKNLEDLQKANSKLKLDTVVSRELDKFDVKKEDKELVSHYLRSQVSIQDDKVLFMDGLPIEDGFKTYFEANKSRLNPIDSGGGSGASGQGGGGRQTMKRADFDKLPPAKQAEMATKLKIED